MIKGMIFDLDGTLLDSMHAWDGVAIEVLNTYGVYTNENLDQRFQSMSIEESINFMKVTYLPNVSKIEIKSTLENIVHKRYQQTLSLKEGVKSYILSLYKKQRKLYIFTASDRVCAIDALSNHQILKCFDRIITCEEIGYSKNDIRAFESVLNSINLHRDEIVVVEDALHALKTAKQVGLQTWAVYDESQKKDWKEITLISDQHFNTMKEMEEYDV